MDFERALPAAVISIVFTSVALILVLTRVYIRLILMKNAGKDDAFMAAAMVFSIAMLVAFFNQIKYGLGRPVHTLSEDYMRKFLTSLWVTVPTYQAALVLTKVSIIFQYKRLFSTRSTIRNCNIMLAVLVLYGAWSVVGGIFMCIPVSNFWNTGMSTNCLDKEAFWFVNAALNLLTDILVLAIPMPLLKNLQLPKKQKVGLMILFGFGAFACITSVIRLRSLYEISNSVDTSLNGSDVVMWSAIETNTAIACASFPALKPLGLLIRGTYPGKGSQLNSSNITNSYSGYRPNESERATAGKNIYARSNSPAEIKVSQTVRQEEMEMRPSFGGSDGDMVIQTDCYRSSGVGKRSHFDIV